MKKNLAALFAAVAFAACCKEICEDQGLLIYTRNMQAVDTDTVYLIRYTRATRFDGLIDTIKRYNNVPPGSTQPSNYSDILDYMYDWRVVIPALHKTYEISAIQTKKEPCRCSGGTYRTVTSFWFTNTGKEGNSVVLE